MLMDIAYVDVPTNVEMASGKPFSYEDAELLARKIQGLGYRVKYGLIKDVFRFILESDAPITMGDERIFKIVPTGTFLEVGQVNVLEDVAEVSEKKDERSGFFPGLEKNIKIIEPSKKQSSKLKY